MLISFRPTRKVASYLKKLNNKSKEINDILEMYIIHGAVKKHGIRYTDGFVDEFGTAKTNSIEDVIQDIKMANEIQEEIREREAPLFDDIEPIEEVIKDKKYYDNLNKYTTIKNMGGCFSATGERLDTQEALAYANLQSFIP